MRVCGLCVYMAIVSNVYNKFLYVQYQCDAVFKNDLKVLF